MFFPTRQRFTAWVVFQGGDHRRFWRIFTRRGWRHCWLIVPAYYPEPGLNAEQYSVILNPVTNHVGLDVVFMAPRDVVKHAIDHGATCVVKLAIDRKAYRDYVPRGVLTCVSLIKAVLGIRAWYVWTPKSLARWMIRNGGTIEALSHDFAFQHSKAETRQGASARAASAGSANSAADGRRGAGARRSTSPDERAA